MTEDWMTASQAGPRRGYNPPVPAIEPRFASSRQPVIGTRGMVASSQPLATAAGLRVLAEGGNAADAAVATAAALNVTEPNMTGIGGDVFALYRDAATGALTALNASGRAPAALDLARVRADGIEGDALPAFHAHTVTVPGACAGWCDTIERHGALPLSRVLAPAIELAERGFPVAPYTSVLWAWSVERQLRRTPGGRALLVEGRAPRAGEVFRNPDLARTLRRVAEKGKEAFYRGEIAEAIARVVHSEGGCLSEADLAAHVSTWEEPIATDFHALRVHECPPNGQGLAALLALSLLRGFAIDELDPLGADRWHLMIECMRLAFADAAWFVADPAFSDVPVAELLSEGYAAERRRLVRRDRAAVDPRRGRPVAGSDTTYLCAIDGAGNACSFINSNYMGFGTGIVPDGFGFTLQNRGAGFRLDPAHPNALAPGKRPYHTIIPGMLTRTADGSLYAPFGVMGGFMQPQGHLQVVVAMAVDGLDPQAALDRPRFCILPELGGRIVVEPELPAAARAELAARGHELHVAEGWGRVQLGRGQIIRRDPSGALWGGSDPRADGCAMTL
jgi:gamma-glutamyltranspeptidase/glutathione hydrolase